MTIDHQQPDHHGRARGPFIQGRSLAALDGLNFFLAAFIALPLRGVLFTLSDNAAYLIAVQVLDGVGAGIFGAVFPVMAADLTRGTGRYNVAFGAATTMQGIGAALSTTLVGAIIVLGGYDRAFLTLTGDRGSGPAPVPCRGARDRLRHTHPDRRTGRGDPTRAQMTGHRIALRQVFTDAATIPGQGQGTACN